ncbi:MAG: hypothetical protein LAP86_17360 [Acidobacteriia bacterium]|nr:hypothetical protein [Terriglobia bacterium]
MSILLFVGGSVFLVLAFSLAVTRGVLGALDVTVFDVYFVVRPLYLLLIAAVLFIGGFVSF